MIKKTTLFLLSLLMTSSLFAQIDGDNIFDQNQIIKIELNFKQTGFWDSLVANYSTTAYMKADLTLTDTTGTYTFNDVGVRLKGNSSYTHPGNKKSFKIDFNEYVKGQKYDGLKKLNFSNGFKDPSCIREKVFFDLCQAAGVPAPRANFANVYFNGTLWGFYTVVEQIDDQFLDWRILDDDGNLFKAGDNFGTSNAAADLKDYGTLQSAYESRYELKTNEDANDWSDLIDLIDFINNSSAADFENQLADRIELAEYLRSAAIDNLFSNLDSYTGSARNYYLYHNLTTDKWEWIKWDANESFGSYGGRNLNMTSLALNYHDNDRPLLANIFNSPKLYDQYLTEMCYVTENFFNPTYITAQVNELKSLVQAAVYADGNKMYTNANFDTNLYNNITSGGGPMGGTTYGLTSFVQAKTSFLAGALDCSLFTDIDGLSKDDIILYPNPAQDFISVKWENLQIESLYLINALGQRIYQEDTFGKSESRIEVSSLEAGMYILVLTSGHDRVTKKLIVN